MRPLKKNFPLMMLNNSFKSYSIAIYVCLASHKQKKKPKASSDIEVNIHFRRTR